MEQRFAGTWYVRPAGLFSLAFLHTVGIKIVTHPSLSNSNLLIENILLQADTHSSACELNPFHDILDRT